MLFASAVQQGYVLFAYNTRVSIKVLQAQNLLGKVLQAQNLLGSVCP